MGHHIKIAPRTVLAGIKVGPSHPVRIMGIINASPESFYAASIKSSPKSIARLAEQIEKEGADFIDVGAMSSAPYLKTEIPEKEEARRLKSAVKAIRKASSLPISIDTYRWGPAEEGLDAGAVILNDITGFSVTPALARLAKKAQGLILMAHPKAVSVKLGHPVLDTLAILKKSKDFAINNGVPSNRIVLDPGIGFFRQTNLAWWKWDLAILNNLEKLTSVGIPLLVGVSRKSFIGHLLGGIPPEKRLAGSLAATVLAVRNGASIIRTHDVLATKQAVLIAESTLI